MFARRSTNLLLAMTDPRGVTTLEYAVIAAAAVGTILSARSFVTALAGVIDSFTAAL